MQKIIFLLILPFFLFSKEGYKITSKEVTFSKNNLLFENDFHLQHSFGTINSKKAFFSNLKKSTTLLLNFEGEVILDINDAGVLKSDLANFDLATSKINFLSDTFVEYKDAANDLKIISKKVQCKLDTKNYLKKPKLDNIYSISFMEDVYLKLEDKFELFAEVADFKKDTISSYINLYPKKDSFLTFIYDNNLIKSKKAKLDIKDNDLFLEKPSGELKTVLKNENYLLSFSSNSLTWHNFENSLTLKDNVYIVNKDFKIFSDELDLVKQNDKNALYKIVSRKNTKIIFNDNSNISTNGIIELDTSRKTILAFSSLDEDIKYQDDLVSISAKKANLSYFDDKNVDFINLENDVKLIYKKDENNVGYAIADQIEYSPKNKLIKLIALNDQKVLFWEDKGSLKLSADEIHIDQKESDHINGIGDVRFTFNVNEENLIQEIFSKYMDYQ